VIRITTADGQDISGTRLGQKLFLRIEMDRASIFGIFARNLKVRVRTERTAPPSLASLPATSR
jgi:hypothetical protein